MLKPNYKLNSYSQKLTRNSKQSKTVRPAPVKHLSSAKAMKVAMNQRLKQNHSYLSSKEVTSSFQEIPLPFETEEPDVDLAHRKQKRVTRIAQRIQQLKTQDNETSQVRISQQFSANIDVEPLDSQDAQSPDITNIDATETNRQNAYNQGSEEQNSIISEKDSAFEDQTPGQQGQIKAFNFTQGINMSSYVPTPQELTTQVSGKYRNNSVNKKAIMMNSKKSISGTNYDMMQQAQITPLLAQSGSKILNTFNSKAKARRMQTVGKPNENKNLKIQKNASSNPRQQIKMSPSHKSGKMRFGSLGMDNDSQTRPPRRNEKRQKFEHMSSMNLSQENLTDQFSINIGKVNSLVKNNLGRKQMSTERNPIQTQGTFSLRSSDGKESPMNISINKKLAVDTRFKKSNTFKSKEGRTSGLSSQDQFFPRNLAVAQESNLEEINSIRPSMITNDSRQVYKQPLVKKLNLSNVKQYHQQINSTPRDELENLKQLLKQLESQTNKLTQKEFEAKLVEAVHGELDKRNKLLQMQLNWVKKQKRICNIYGQPVNQVVGNAMNVTEGHHPQSQTKNGGDTFRLKGLNANLLKPLRTNRRSAEAREAKELLAKSSTRRSIVVQNQDGPVDLRKLVDLCDSYKASAEAGVNLHELFEQVQTAEAQLNLLLSEQENKDKRNVLSPRSQEGNKLKTYQMSIRQLNKLMYANKLQTQFMKTGNQKLSAPQISLKQALSASQPQLILPDEERDMKDSQDFLDEISKDRPVSFLIGDDSMDVRGRKGKPRNLNITRTDKVDFVKQNKSKMTPYGIPAHRDQSDVVVAKEVDVTRKRPTFYSNIDKLKLEQFDRLPVREKRSNVLDEVRKSRQKLINSGAAIVGESRDGLGYQFRNQGLSFDEKASQYSLQHQQALQNKFHNSEKSKMLISVFQAQRAINRNMRSGINKNTKEGRAIYNSITASGDQRSEVLASSGYKFQSQSSNKRSPRPVRNFSIPQQ